MITAISKKRDMCICKAILVLLLACMFVTVDGQEAFADNGTEDNDPARLALGDKNIGQATALSLDDEYRMLRLEYTPAKSQAEDFRIDQSTKMVPSRIDNSNPEVVSVSVDGVGKSSFSLKVIPGIVGTTTVNITVSPDNGRNFKSASAEVQITVLEKANPIVDFKFSEESIDLYSFDNLWRVGSSGSYGLQIGSERVLEIVEVIGEDPDKPVTENCSFTFDIMDPDNKAAAGLLNIKDVVTDTWNTITFKLRDFDNSGKCDAKIRLTSGSISAPEIAKTVHVNIHHGLDTNPVMKIPFSEVHLPPAVEHGSNGFPEDFFFADYSESMLNPSFNEFMALSNDGSSLVGAYRPGCFESITCEPEGVMTVWLTESSTSYTTSVYNGECTLTIRDIWGNEGECKVYIEQDTTDALFEPQDITLQMYSGAPLVNVMGTSDPEMGLLRPTAKAQELADEYHGLEGLVRSVETSNSEIAWVDSNPQSGTLHIVAGGRTGQASITVTDVLDNVYSISVTVDDGSTIDTSVIGFKDSQKTLNVGDVIAYGDILGLYSTSTPSAAYNYLSIASSDKEVLEYKIDGNGPSLVAKKPGTVTLYLLFAPWSASPVPVQCDTMTVTVVDPNAPETVPVEGISLDKSAAAISGAGTEQLSASVLPSNASNKTVNWSSSDERVATVDAAGTVTSVGKGTATITATTADGGKTATCEVTVSNPVTSVEVDASSLALRKGESKTLTATYAGALPGAVDRVGTSIFSDAENSIVSISDMRSTDGSDSPIVLTATVTALRSEAEVLTFLFEPEGQTPVASCEVTVVTPVESIEVSPASKQVELAAGATETFTLSAFVLPDDADEKGIVWASSDEAVALVDGSGNVTVVGLGEAKITATAKDGSGVSGSCALTVLEKVVPATGVTISGDVSALRVGEKAQLSAFVEPEGSTDTVVWSSSDETVLTVDQSGLVTAVGNGSATISAEAGEASDTTAAIEVTTPVTAVSLDAVELELYVGADPSRLTATVTPATASNPNVTWVSSDHDVATVDGEGMVVPVGPGSATITATTVDGGYTASCAVTVKQHVTGIALDKSTAEIKGADSIELKATVAPDNATNKEVTWASDDESVAVVDGTGKVASIGKGEAVITATTVDGQFSASCVVTVANPVTRVSVEPSSLNLVKGDSATVLASLSGTLPGETDGASIEWLSSDETVATVDEYGTVTAKKTGAATITAKAGEGLFATCSVAVTNPVQSVVLSETSKTVVVGEVDSFRLSASVNPEDGDGAETITWASSNEAVATVAADGTVIIKRAGETIITATSGGKMASCALVVEPVTITAQTGAAGFTASVQVTDPALAKELKRVQAEEGLNLVVQAIDALTDPAKAAIDALTKSGNIVAEGFDIYFVKENGEEVSLNGNDGVSTITVKVKLTEAMKALVPASLKVHFVGDDGTVEDKETWSDGEYLYFVTEHFSTYVVTGKPLPSGEVSDGTPELVPLDTGKNLLARTGDLLWPVAAGTAAVVGAAVCLICLASSRRKKS